MLFSNRAKQFPHLTRYVESRGRAAFPIGEVALAVCGSFLAALGLLILVVTGALGGNIAAPEIMLVLGLLGVGAAILSRKLKRLRKDPLHEQAEGISKALRQMLHHRRLKPKPNPIFTVLEESSFQWFRIQAAFDSTFWGRSDLIGQYRTLRDQTRAAADRAMCESLILSSPHLFEPGGADWGVALDAVLREHVLKIPAGEEPLPREFAPARAIADKLRSLADEVESLSKSAAQNPDVLAEASAESALDVCLNDLRSVREAETELRQNLHGS